MKKSFLRNLDTVGLLLLVIAVLWYASAGWVKLNIALALLGAVLLVVGVAANYRQIMAALGKRSAKYASNYVASILLIIAVVIGVNYIGSEHPKRFDLTQNSQFTLAPQTVQVLKKLNADIEIKSFFPGGVDEPLKALLVEYRGVSKRVNFEFYDPNKRPDIANQYGVKTYGTVQNILTGSKIKFGTVIVLNGKRQEKIENRSGGVEEQDLTNAIIRASRSEVKKIYFVQGHGEKDPSNEERDGYSLAQKTIEGQGYPVGTLNLNTAKIPDDAKVLIVAGPKGGFFPEEVQKLNDFLNKGGRGLFLLLDPIHEASLDGFLKEWGIVAEKGVERINTAEGQAIDGAAFAPIISRYESHKITDNFNLDTVFPFTRSIRADSTLPSGIKVDTLFKSGDDSWVETNMDLERSAFDPKTDIKGPNSLAVAVTKDIKAASENASAVKSQLVVAGTSQFPMNYFWMQGGNSNLFMNMLSWLAQDNDLLFLRPKTPESRQILFSQNQLVMIKLATLVLLPGAALIIGVSVIMKRRRR